MSPASPPAPDVPDAASPPATEPGEPLSPERSVPPPSEDREPGAAPAPAPAWIGALPYAALAATLAVLVIAILRENDGAFSYSLDDPYIHLALSENLAQGHHGIEPDRPSAPSSSVVWPMLLAPLAGSAAHGYVPLAINVLALFLSAFLFDRILREAGLGRAGRPALLRAGLVFAVPLCLNAVGIVLTGLEHSLAIVFVLATVLGLARFQASDRIGAWLVAGIVLGPLVRYENVVFSAGALLSLVIHGRVRAGLVLGALMAAPLAAFSAFLVSQGLAWLPSSVRTKSHVAAGDSFSAIYDAFARNLDIARDNDQGRVLLALVALFALRLVFDRSRASLALVAAAGIAVSGHVLGGRYGWFGRYEVYALVGGFAFLFLVQREALGGLTRRIPALLLVALLCAPLAYLMPGLWRTTKRTPQAAGEIYRQQYQLHRLAKAWDGPIALNDIGWASFQNEHAVLDIFGLCDDRVRELRFGDDPSWLGDLLDEEGVQAAALFENPSPPWFSNAIPERWIRVGELRLGGWRVLKVPAVVGIYATVPEAVEPLSAALGALEEGAPSRVSVRLAR